MSKIPANYVVVTRLTSACGPSETWQERQTNTALTPEADTGAPVWLRPLMSSRLNRLSYLRCNTQTK